jgi:hypothetical protein
VRPYLRGAWFLTLFSALLPLGKEFGVFRVYTIDLMLWPSLFFFSLWFMMQRHMKAPSWSPIEKLFIVIFVMMCFAAPFSSYPINTLDKLLIWCRWIALYVLFKVFWENGIIQLDDWRKWWVFFGFFLLALGALQIVTLSDIGLIGNYFGEDVTETQRAFGVIPRVSGTAKSSNVYGQWLVIFTLLVNARILFTPRRRIRPALFFLLAFCLEAVVVLFSLSRGTLVFFGLANFVILFIWIKRKRKNLILTILGFTSLVFLVIGFGYQYYQDIEPVYILVERFDSNADDQRMAMLRLGWDLLDKPKVLLLGTGLGAFLPALAKYGIGTAEIREEVDLSKRAYGIHNIFLLLLVEGGIFVFAAFCLFYLASIRKALRIMRNLEGTPRYYVGVYLFSVLVALLFPMQIYVSTISWNVWIFVLVLIAVVNSIRLEDGDVETIQGPKRSFGRPEAHVTV